MGKKDMDKSPKKVKILSKHMDRISIASVCKSNNRIKIKTLRYLFSPITLKKNEFDSILCWQICGKTNILTHYWWECTMFKCYGKENWQNLCKTKLIF